MEGVRYRMRPGTKALIIHKNKILMVHEKVMRNGKEIVITDFPGGGIEFGEHPKDGLKREVQEEVGLDIKIEKIVGTWDFVLEDIESRDPSYRKVHIICIGYQCRLVGSEKIDVNHNPAPEHIFDAKWYSKEELLANPELLRNSEDMMEAVRNLDL